MNRTGANSSRPGPAATQSAAGSAASPVAVTEAGWLMSDRAVLVLAGAAGLGAWLAWPVPLLIAVAGLVTVVLVPRWRQVFTLPAIAIDGAVLDDAKKERLRRGCLAWHRF